MPSLVLPVLKNGLLIEVKVWLSAPRREALWRRHGQGHVPVAVSGTFIIDTGADTTMISDQFVRTLQLPVIDQRDVLTSSSNGVPEKCDVYDAEIKLLAKSGEELCSFNLPVFARPLLNQGTDGMIGRDILDRLVLTYNGPKREFTVHY